MKFLTLKKKRQSTLKCACGRAAEPTLLPYFIPALAGRKAVEAKTRGAPGSRHPPWDLDRGHEGPGLELQSQRWVGSPGVNHLGNLEPSKACAPRRGTSAAGGSTTGAWEERMRIKMETYAWLRRRARGGHPPGTACALPRTWDGGASGKSQLHRAAAGRSRQTSVGDARMEDRLVGNRTARLGTAGPARCTAAKVAPADPRPAAKVPALVAASQESVRKPRESFRPARTDHLVFLSSPGPGKVSFLEKYPRKASCVNEPVRGLVWGFIVGVSFSFHGAKRSMFNFGYSHFRYLK